VNHVFIFLKARSQHFILVMLAVFIKLDMQQEIRKENILAYMK